MASLSQLAKDVKDWIPWANAAAVQDSFDMEGVIVHQLAGVFNGGSFRQPNDDERAAVAIEERSGADEDPLVLQIAQELAVDGARGGDGF